MGEDGTDLSNHAVKAIASSRSNDIHVTGIRTDVRMSHLRQCIQKVSMILTDYESPLWHRDIR